MNLIRAKIISTWLLVLMCLVLFYFRFWFLGSIVSVLSAFLRHSKPKLSQPSKRLEHSISIVVICFLILVLIHAFHPFPSAVVTAGKVLGWLLIVPLVGHTLYSDYRMFQEASRCSERID